MQRFSILIAYAACGSDPPHEPAPAPESQEAEALSAPRGPRTLADAITVARRGRSHEDELEHYVLTKLQWSEVDVASETTVDQIGRAELGTHLCVEGEIDELQVLPTRPGRRTTCRGKLRTSDRKRVPFLTASTPELFHLRTGRFCGVVGSYELLGMFEPGAH